MNKPEPKAKLPFALTNAEIAACARLFEHLETRIAALQRENENPNTDDVATGVLRGHIKGFREILRLQEPRSQESPPGQ